MRNLYKIDVGVDKQDRVFQTLYVSAKDVVTADYKAVRFVEKLRYKGVHAVKVELLGKVI